MAIKSYYRFVNDLAKDTKTTIDSISGSLPDQTGHSGKYLTTNGTTASWATVSASATWGAITGTLSSQTDLQTALNGKSDTSHNHSGTYEPAITKSTGYAKWTGAAWSFVNESYSLSTHDHTGIYQPLATVLTNTTASFTTAQETKLSGIATGAEVNVNPDWNAGSGDAQILNKPTTLSGYGITDAVPSSRTISTTAPLTGGGALSGNLTLAVSTFTSIASGVVPSSGGGTTNFLRADGTWATPPGGSGSSVFTTVEVSLGTKPKKAGYFNITSSGLTVGKHVQIWQAVGPYTGKGTREDEVEMDAVVITGVVTTTTNIKCYWNSPTRVRGNRKFNYLVGA